ncbi:MAG: alpha/beta hydrolase [Bacilli bacterium]|nr:alpha/beta hydrolase [Bacilli bacterium]
MGKLLKGIGITILAIILVGVALLFVMCGVADNRNKNYWKYAKPYGEIEKTYTALGSYEVSIAEYNSNNSYKKYEVWYPTEMNSNSNKYPLVIMANGTGVKASQYKEVFKHLASWGFIVAGNEDDNSRSGDSSSKTLDYLLQLNEDSNSVFYQKIDTDNIGIAGHSQGGVGAMNAVTEQANGIKYKAIWTASTTSRCHADNLNKKDGGWTCYPNKINIPIMMVAGTGATDAGNLDHYTETVGKDEVQGICPKWWLEECFNEVINAPTKIIAREKDKDHGDMLRYADGYMTAWFMYHLKGQTSADFFAGETSELMSNKNWQDVKVNSIS